MDVVDPPPLQAMNHIMEYSRIAGYIVILWWQGQSQLKLDMSMPDHNNIRIHLWMVAWWGLLTCRRRIFFGKNGAPVIFRTCNSPVEVFLCAASVFFPASSDSQMALAIFVMGGAYKSRFPESTSIHKWLWLWLGPLCDAMDYPPVSEGDV